MPAELPSTEQIFTETSRLVPLWLAIPSAPKLKTSKEATKELHFDTKLGPIRLIFQFLRLSKVLVIMAPWKRTDLGGHRGIK